MKITKNILSLSALLMISGMGAALGGDLENSNRDVDAKYNVQNDLSYPGAFYGRHFTGKNGSHEAFSVIAMYSGEFEDPGKIITGPVKDFLKCSKMDFKSSGSEDEVYDSDTFRGCVTPSGKVFNGFVGCTGGFHWFTLYSADMPEADVEAISAYDTDFRDSLAAQDYPSVEAPSEKANKKLPAGYVLLPTFRYPLDGAYAYIAKTYVNPDTGRLFSYQIVGAEQLRDFDVSGGVKEFCGSGATLKAEGKDSSLIGGCSSRQWVGPEKVLGKITNNVSANKLTVAEVYSANMSEADLAVFRAEVQDRVKNFNPKDFEF